MAWGNRHLAPEGPNVVVLDTETGKAAEPVMVDRTTGRPLTDPVFRIGAGPAASDKLQQRFAAAAGGPSQTGKHA